MKTIKFRGYNKKNSQWLYGFYLQNRGEHFVCPDEFATGKSWEDYEVDPTSVGQFTGLLDGKERPIYEGDIYRHDCFPPYWSGGRACPCEFGFGYDDTEEVRQHRGSTQQHGAHTYAFNGFYLLVVLETLYDNLKRL